MKHLVKKFVMKFFLKFILYYVFLQNLMNKQGRRTLLLVLYQLKGFLKLRIVFLVGKNQDEDSKIKLLALVLNLAKMNQNSKKNFPIIAISLIKKWRLRLIRKLKIQSLLLLYLLVMTIINHNFRTDYKALRSMQQI